MADKIKRRNFIQTSTLATMGLSINGFAFQMENPIENKTNRVGIIGLDTSHSVAFTKILNAKDAESDVSGHRVVAAYPHGSNDIESSVSRIAGYTEDMEKLEVKIMDSIADLLDVVDVVLLETNDGRLHLEQAMQVFKAGKPVFIDKPVAASFSDANAIFEAAKKYKVPMFSSSSVRFIKNAQDIRKGNTVGKVIGANTFSPAYLEKTHPDLFWYGIHGVEMLFTVMGSGCISVTRSHTEDTDVVVGIWDDGRIGTFRGGRSGKIGFGGTAFGETGNAEIGPYEGYRSLLVEIVKFFRTGMSPINEKETLEIYAFMEAADISKSKGGQTVLLDSVYSNMK